MNEIPSLYAVTVKGFGRDVKLVVQGTSEKQVTEQFRSFGIKVYFNKVKSFVQPPSEEEGCTPMQPSLFNE